MVSQIKPGTTRVGWIGTGVMGGSMCGHLVKAGYQATVFNRTPEKLSGLVSLGAKAVGSPRAVAEASDVVFTIVGYPKDVRDVTLGAGGILEGAKPGTIVVNMTTSEPALAREIFEACKAKDVHAVDAPFPAATSGARGEVVDHGRRRAGDRRGA